MRVSLIDRNYLSINGRHPGYRKPLDLLLGLENPRERHGFIDQRSH